MGRPLRIDGRYRLVEKLGAGGMSVVWRGYDERLGRDVAVKVLSPGLADNRAFRDRLRQEALAAARLCHPHITGVYDFGEAFVAGTVTVPYVVMELHDGESVGARIGRQGALAWREAVMIAAEVASALATAHARGVVHRDVTPANVMLTGAGAKVVDFGISALVGQRDAAPDGSLLGTPAYLAPERLAGADVSPATDVYALGLLLYRSLTGRMPWPAQSTTEALRAHLYADPEPIPDLPELPAVVAELCLRCLAKSPEERPDAADVARGLAATVGLQPIIPPLRRRPTVARGVVPASVVRAATAARPSLARFLSAGHPFGRHLAAMRTRATVLATVLTLMTTAGMWSVRRDGGETAGPETAVAGPVVEDIRCTVRYEVQRDSGARYAARLTVVTSATGDWLLEFAYPGTQRLAQLPADVTQQGRQVVVSGRGRERAVTLHGGYRDRNPLPLAFAVNRRPCRTEVLGATARDTESVNAATAGRERAATDRGRVDSGAGSGAEDRERQPARRGEARGPRRERVAPVAPPAPKRTGGFSLAQGDEGA